MSRVEAQFLRPCYESVCIISRFAKESRQFVDRTHLRETGSINRRLLPDSGLDRKATAHSTSRMPSLNNACASDRGLQLLKGVSNPIGHPDAFPPKFRAWRWGEPVTSSTDAPGTRVINAGLLQTSQGSCSGLVCCSLIDAPKTPRRQYRHAARCRSSLLTLF